MSCLDCIGNFVTKSTQKPWFRSVAILAGSVGLCGVIGMVAFAPSEASLKTLVLFAANGGSANKPISVGDFVQVTVSQTQAGPDGVVDPSKAKIELDGEAIEQIFAANQVPQIEGLPGGEVTVTVVFKAVKAGKSSGSVSILSEEGKVLKSQKFNATVEGKENGEPKLDFNLID